MNVVDDDAVVVARAPAAAASSTLGDDADADDGDVGGNAIAGSGLDRHDAAALPDDRGRPAS